MFKKIKSSFVCTENEYVYTFQFIRKSRKFHIKSIDFSQTLPSAGMKYTLKLLIHYKESIFNVTYKTYLSIFTKKSLFVVKYNFMFTNIFCGRKLQDKRKFDYKLIS